MTDSDDASRARSPSDLYGPAERALAELLAEPGVLGAAAAGEVSIEPCDKANVGDFKVELGGLVPADRREAQAYCRDVAAKVAAHAAVEKAVAIPPRVYVRPGLDALARWVTAGIHAAGDAYGQSALGAGGRMVVSFSSPNANKPLHLGHMRNNFLGVALANLFEACGWQVARTAVLSDWGVHICQAALAYDRWGEGATPESAGAKGDAFVGDYYVRFHRENARQKGDEEDDGEAETELEREAQALLRAAESGDPRAWALQQSIVDWAVAGLEASYARLGSRFDAVLRERDMLPTARRLIGEAVQTGVCRVRDDGSVFIDLSEGDMGEVTLLRGDGTALAYTQLIGAYVYRSEFFQPDGVVIVLGHEWELGLRIITETLRRFHWPPAEALEPIFYGMVTLPHGKMKSRQGTVVEVDELLDRAADQMRRHLSQERVPERVPGDAPEGGVDVPDEVCAHLGTGLLKYYFLRCKRMGEIPYDEDLLWRKTLPPFQRILTRMAADDAGERASPAAAEPLGKRPREARRKLLLLLNDFPRAIQRGAAARDPNIVLRLVDDAAEEAGRARLEAEGGELLRPALASVLRAGTALLGIELPSELGEWPGRLARAQADGA